MSSYRDVTREVKSESDRLIKRFLDSTKSLVGFLTQILLPLKSDYLQKKKKKYRMILKHIGWNVGLKQHYKHKKTIIKTSLLVSQADKLLAYNL